jgi:hypothetical protein
LYRKKALRTRHSTMRQGNGPGSTRTFAIESMEATFLR